MARGDAEFAEFAGASFQRLRRAAYLLTGNSQQAEDAAQTALVKTYAAWRRVQRQDPYAYTRRIMVNHLKDQWRRPIREDAHELERLPDRASEQDLAGDITEQRWLLAALAKLADRERAVVVLRHYFDLSERDVAAELDIAVGTVKSLNARALAKLRISLDTEPVMNGVTS
ncbi:SigE family RNA polymerase sigma factor [Winogradskya consettensis]|uniref:DNA-directed RNA polymerase sigma-70 factor n=1 Tax=Winogradskya consettensis TaxID=113560 RepID=A0A919SK06_9ACTN|nr:SigE family RNA polymerase sigma factor [Actinoplanes consettensis]GIM72994.1 DNA-directed RNA polymerase sigma-70 factor [Actinoplanes consettensis]